MEIKRTDLPENSSLSEVYKWLILTRAGQVLELEFESMDKNGAEELRLFLEGELRFNEKEACLSLLDKDFHLERKHLHEASAEDLDLVRKHLSLSGGHDLPSALRPLRPSDVSFFKQWIRDQEVIRYSMTKFHRIKDESQVVEWFRQTLFDSKSYQFGIVGSDSGELIGYTGIAAINEIDRNGEYFIFIGNKSFWGKGIASFVTKEITRLGFQNLNLHRIFLTASSSNPGAIRAYEKAGFVHEGRMREAFFRDNEYSDKIIMGILKSEFNVVGGTCSQ